MMSSAATRRLLVLLLFGLVTMISACPELTGDGTFECGASSCSEATEYCEETFASTFDPEPTAQECKAIPDACLEFYQIPGPVCTGFDEDDSYNDCMDAALDYSGINVGCELGERETYVRIVLDR